MKSVSIFLLLLFSMGCFSQEKALVYVPEIPEEQVDSMQHQMIPEIFIGVNMEEEKYKRDMIILRNRLRRVYPYAVATAENLVTINENLANMPTKSEKRKYIRRSQKYLEGQFKERLKKLSRNDGKILLKLIDRQTGETAFSLIKELKSGWTAFWGNVTAKTFSLNLKSEYHPGTDIQDFYIETQLQYLFFRRELTPTEGVPAIPYNQIRLKWAAEIGGTDAFPLELRE